MKNSLNDNARLALLHVACFFIRPATATHFPTPGHFLPHQQVDRENLLSRAAAISTNALDQGMRLLSPSTIGKRHMLQQDESTVHHDHIA